MEAPQAQAILSGRLERFTFRSPDTGFAVVRIAPGDGSRVVHAVGLLAQLSEGQDVKLTGVYRNHPRFGLQLEVESLEVLAPSSAEGIAAYLASQVKGVGPATAGRIVARFGLDTLRIIDEEPDRLREVKGLGQQRISELVADVRAHKEMQNVLVFLRTYGLGQALAARIVRHYGAAAAHLIKANPYRLADEVIGVGFATADALAGQLGLGADAPERLQAGILHTLGQAARDGHCFLPEPVLLERAAELLQVRAEAVGAELASVLEDQRVVRETPPGPRVLQEGAPLAIYPRALHQAEEGTARRLHLLLRHMQVPLPVRAPQALAWFERQSRMTLPSTQRQALVRALQEPVSVITGGPGVGKTTIIRALVEILRAKNLRLLLAAPTGRAAKRLEEATGQSASTVHRLLEFQPGINRFQRNEHAPLEAHMLVVDESSMVDVQLAYNLLRAVPPGMKLVLVGDPDQLPAVGPGNVLADLIASGRVAVTALTEIFRQQEHSLIVSAAHQLLEGRAPQSGGEGSDFYFVETASSAQTRGLVQELVVRRIPRAFGLDALRDIQVLCPMYRGEAGADTINRDLQDLLNPGQPQVERGGKVYRQGDRVMQIRNDYELDVFNGDVGHVTHIDRARAVVGVRLGEREVEYAFPELDQLVPAYAITVHRAQGSEYPAVVVPLATDHFMMLRRRLLYTAITRGRRLVVLVGSAKALHMAVRNHEEAHRWSALAERLKDQLRGIP